MKILLLGFWLFCFFETRVQSKPQITKLFPVQEAIEYHQRVSNEMKPLDKFLGKLRATYDFVFRKPENTSNVERILAKDAPNANLQAANLLWSDRIQPISRNSENTHGTEGTLLTMQDEDWVNDVQPLDHLEPLEPLDMENEMGDKNRDVEIITPKTSFQLPATLSRHLVDWLGSLLGITYGVYSKLARAIYSNNTGTEH
ncbi:uncharacterized protein LOC143177435 [Calliopsis andreniformis]|uniref:uncharacterized protein LOC143177435 n=1 Tax=Calliopsis andreniformis TaxID=337506 RepID=UPI003FCD1A34